MSRGAERRHSVAHELQRYRQVEAPTHAAAAALARSSLALLRAVRILRSI